MKYSVEQLLSVEGGRWDRRIATDLATELEIQLGEKEQTIPEIRRLLAVKGFRELRKRLELETWNKKGEEAVRAMAFSMRAFAHERPGLSAAAFRSPATDSIEWRQEGERLSGLAIEIFIGSGLDARSASTALRILRALVRGFVLHEMAASFLDGVDYEQTFVAAVDVFIRGLDALRAPPAGSPI
ncbi:MAG: TetR-like C-terminal domain-containing protein [Bradyrhizobium sp.]